MNSTNITQNNGITTLDDDFFKGVKPAPPSMLITKTANEWIEEGEKQPRLKLYISELLTEGDCALVYGESNGGKTLFGVQSANSIAMGESVKPFINENSPQIVLYCDCELNIRQFTARYSGIKFSPNFYRCELNPYYESRNFEAEIIQQIEQQALNIGAKVVFVDNLTWLLNETEKGSDAGKLMKSLLKLKDRIDITLIVVAHTPKRSGTESLGLKDIAGSSRLGNFATSAMAIGKSIKDEHLRYIKCTKTRLDANEHGAENVAVFQITKNNGGLLGFEFVGYDTERNHLMELPEQKRIEEFEVVKEMYIKGMRQIDIASTLGCSLGKVNGIIKKIRKSNEKMKMHHTTQ
jgi:KaiC/GvpD/RAD55 family RecA-like ATPase